LQQCWQVPHGTAKFLARSMVKPLLGAVPL